MVARKKVAPEVHPGVVRELVLTTTTDGDLYRQQVQPLITNLAKKLAKGVFDRDKAVVAMGYLADNGARKYAWAYGDRGGARSWAQVPLASSGFNAATRRAAAAEMLDEYMEEITQKAREFAPKARKAPTSRANGRKAAAPRMTMADVRLLNWRYHRSRGDDFTYFDRKTSRFFGPEKTYGPYRGPGGVFFVMVNRAGVGIKQVQPDGDIDSVGTRELHVDDARVLARELAAGKRTIASIKSY